MVHARLALAVVPTLSVTVAATVKLPGAVGVPESTPAADAVTPAGNPPTVQVYGGTPPAADSVADTGVPTVPAESEAVMVRVAGVTASVRLAEAVVPFASVTVTPTVELPAAVGVPLIAPAAEADNPAGKPLTAQAYGCTPPAAARLAEYAVPTVPLESDVVVTVSGAGVTASARLAEAVAPFESVTVTPTVKLPAAVGAPVITPAVEADKPAGKPVALQV
jgi:hypothetical protein